MPGTEASAFNNLVNTTTPNDPGATPDPATPPAWADQLLQTVQGIKSEFDTFREQLTTPEPLPDPEPPVVPQADDSWIPKTYADVDQRIVERAQEIAANTLAERDRQTAEQAAAEDQQVKDVEKYLDQQIATLEQGSVIPKVSNPADKSDPGRQARAELFGYAYSLGTTNLLGVADTLKTFHGQGLRYDVKENKFVPLTGSQATGATAPLAGSGMSGAVATNSQPGPDFFRKNSLDMVAEYAKRAIS